MPNGGAPDPTIEDLIRASMTARNVSNIDDLMQRSIRFQGLRGKCDVDTWERIYLNAQLTEYIEVNKYGIVAEVELGGAGSPLILVVIDPDSTINHVVTQTESIEGDFLVGSITQGSQGAAQPFPSPGMGGFGQWGTNWAQTNNCGSWSRTCGSWAVC
jgi:hypothetical protein